MTVSAPFSMMLDPKALSSNCQTLENQCQQNAFPMVYPNQTMVCTVLMQAGQVPQVLVPCQFDQGVLVNSFQTPMEATSQQFCLLMPAGGAYQSDVQPHQQTCYGQPPQAPQLQSLPTHQQLEPQLSLHMHQEQQQELQQQSLHKHQQQLEQQQHQQVSQHQSMSEQSLLMPASGLKPHGPLPAGKLSPETQKAWSDGSASEAAEIAPQHTKPSTSAARRMRRRRAAERAASGLTDAVSSSQDATDLQTTTQSSQSQALGPARCQELKGWLEEGTGKHATVLNEMKDRVWLLSQDAIGCRLVQAAFERCNRSEAIALVQELRGHVVEATQSPHANYVVQKAVTQLPLVRFIAEELCGNASKVAKHPYGCRILCRLSEHGGECETTQQLFEEVLRDPDLLKHGYGHHVAQSILEHGSVRHKAQVAALILQDPLGYARDRNSSYLVEKALDPTICSPEDQRLLVAQLEDPATIADLALHPSGCFVAKTLLQRSDIEKQTALSLIQSACAKTGGDRAAMAVCRQLLEQHGLAAPLDESTGADSA
eukprot:TRINITY_DN36726_c0_g3_i1.p1 TRINITY_DN36726_c0_g3~~TRINITY_DN36726_c0_g3_i1.p1  ORF type:complete len:541 (-),score=117.19 TRINITY_DN36726_c0_g3_i1:59-1681(-)